MDDVPIKTINILLIILAQKLKKRVDEIPLSTGKSIKDLVHAKSTLQNEILGDLQQDLAPRGNVVYMVSVTCHSCCGKVFKGALPVTFYTNAKE